MPWRETSPMEQRLEFVREYDSGLFTMTELAAEYGISRKTGYKWLVSVDGRDASQGARADHESPPPAAAPGRPLDARTDHARQRRLDDR